jgi:hypothetical protein
MECLECRAYEVYKVISSLQRVGLLSNPQMPFLVLRHNGIVFPSPKLRMEQSTNNFDLFFIELHAFS